MHQTLIEVRLRLLELVDPDDAPAGEREHVPPVDVAVRDVRRVDAAQRAQRRVRARGRGRRRVQLMRAGEVLTMGAASWRLALGALRLLSELPLGGLSSPYLIFDVRSFHAGNRRKSNLHLSKPDRLKLKVIASVPAHLLIRIIQGYLWHRRQPGFS
ncbi:hypothetical protein PsYK624_152860 [Phanerochaete sordida]|uniref:Uncharacterized protein n=1 Tax=Phanerochaete sordida TaxID=48140 RepID=A0A9P3GQK7_9APHY|nr:hypothetical protein PsYK624_152860 [Phanerochaete sordida]